MYGRQRTHLSQSTRASGSVAHPRMRQRRAPAHATASRTRASDSVAHSRKRQRRAPAQSAYSPSGCKAATTRVCPKRTRACPYERRRNAPPQSIPASVSAAHPCKSPKALAHAIAPCFHGAFLASCAFYPRVFLPARRALLMKRRLLRGLECERTHELLLFRRR